MASNIDLYLQKYHNFLIKNPLVASEIEVGLKWLSYIAAGRFSHSPVITELIHSVSNLLTLFNDNILRRAANIPVHSNVTVEKLQNYLATIEYSEVFAEVAAHRLVGKRGRWIIIIVLQVIKTVIRLLLLLKYQVGIQHSPPVAALNRKFDLSGLSCNKECAIADGIEDVEVTFTLKRSGRVVRTLDAAPSLVSRSWKLPKTSNMDMKLCYQSPSTLLGKQLAGEVLHVCRPLIHLLFMGCCGEFSWKPWLISLGIDATSLQILQSGNFNRAEKLEISRRALSLIVYLLRSPFYNHYSKIHILHSLKIIADNVPGSGILLRPVIEYIPEWQQIYFYTWAL